MPWISAPEKLCVYHFDATDCFFQNVSVTVYKLIYRINIGAS